MTDPDARPSDAPGWWPHDRQRDWQELPVADVDWLVVWNVNLGGGGDAFSVHNGHWGDHPFRPNEVPLTRAWVWRADDVAAPPSWTGIGDVGGIISRIALTARGVPTRSGTILLPAEEDLDDLVRLATAVDDECAQQDAGWCPALVGDRSGPRLGVSVQRGALTSVDHDVAERLGIDDVIFVDPFGDRPSASPTDPHILVRGRRNGSDRRARPGPRGARRYPGSTPRRRAARDAVVAEVAVPPQRPACPRGPLARTACSSAIVYAGRRWWSMAWQFGHTGRRSSTGSTS